jgi:hypothetical protein
MSRKVRVKQSKINAVDTSSINGLFEEMVGMKDADPNIIRPKFVKARNLIRYIHSILNMLANLKDLDKDYPKLKQPMDEIKKYLFDMKESVYFSTDKEDVEDRYQEIDKTDMNNLYKKLKENVFTKQLVLLGSRLKQYKSNLEDPTNIKDNFIGQEPGLSFTIFDFSTLDLKQIWAEPKMSPSIKKIILQVLHKIYKSTLELYEIITSPDVDLDEFIALLLDSIGQLKKQPGLNRCLHAFKRIEDSVALLKDNFGKYYRDSISCGNPDIIVQNFIVDVSNAGGPDARLTSEFRKIIQYMHNMSNQNGRSKDPKVKKLFQILNKNFEIMEKNTPKPKIGTLDDIDLELREQGEDLEPVEQDNEPIMETPGAYDIDKDFVNDLDKNVDSVDKNVNKNVVNVNKNVGSADKDFVNDLDKNVNKDFVNDLDKNVVSVNKNVGSVDKNVCSADKDFVNDLDKDMDKDVT